GSANVGTKMEKKKLPPHAQRCGITGGGGWRCKNFRMGHGAAADDDTVPKSRCCGKHYNFKGKYNQNHLNKRSGDGEAAGCNATAPTKFRGLKRRRKKVPGEDNRSRDVTGSIQPATSDDTCE
ncbi:hypothetical protein MKX03_020841, partial [Papaver bracteatum]